MKNRYVIKRVGFVNFWLYRDQEFYFEDGKLLIRGANASGKSITTQSVIPFILDGDKRPERLDPFGSRDRKMEYYFLGLDDREDVTGYIYIEFYNEEKNHHMTIGIGQRARRNAAMSFWGFILKDGRRIKNDFNLYNIVGSKKIPYSKTELKNKLGNENILVETQTEYENLVNEHLFGFENKDEYKRLINLLIKIRGSKLSRDFRPTQMYEILNDSLQTLSEEDIRGLITEMESLDSSIESIKELEESIKEVKVISREFERYNRYLLYMAGKEFNENNKKYISLENEIKDKEKSISKLFKVIEDKEEENKLIKERLENLYKEKEIIGIDDFEEKIRDLNKSQERLKKLKESLTDTNEKIERYNKRNNNILNQIDQIKRDIRDDEDKLVDIKNTIVDIIDNEFFNEKELVKEVVSQKDTNKLAQFQVKLKNYIDIISNVIEILKELEVVEAEFDIINKEENDLKLKAETARINHNNAVTLLNNERDNLIKDIYEFTNNCRLIEITEDELQRMKDAVISYKLNDKYDGIYSVLENNFRTLEKNLALQGYKIQEELNKVNKEILSFKEEITRLENEKEVDYLLSDDHKNTIDILNNNYINYSTLYRAMDFKEGTNIHIRNKIERLFKEFGLLDLVFISKVDKLRAKNLLENNHYKIFDETYFINGSKDSDKFNKVNGKKASLYSFLEIVHEDKSIRDEVETFINTIDDLIKIDEETFDISISNLDINILSNVNYEYIGETGRLNAIKRKIGEITLKINQGENEKRIHLENLEEIKLKESILEEERAMVPKLVDLNASLSLEKETNLIKEDLSRKHFEVTTKAKEIENRLVLIQNELISHTRNISLERNLKRYKDAYGNLSDAREYTNDLRELILSIKLKYEKQSLNESTRDEIQNNLDEYYIKLRDIESEVKVFENNIEIINNYLNKEENIQKRQKIDFILNEIKNLENENLSNRDVLVASKTKIESDREIIESKEREFLSLKEEVEILKSIFIEEVEFNFIFDKERVKESTIDELIKDSLELLKGNEKEHSYQEIYDSLSVKLNTSATRLYSNYRLNQDNHRYRARESRSRKLLNLYFEASNLPLKVFEERIIQSKKLKEEFVKEEDRKIFKEILTGILGVKLTSRIRDSRAWINRMSQIMENIETSMKLTFSLDWRAKIPESESELSVKELVEILNRHDAATNEDIEKIVEHFRRIINKQKLEAEIKNEELNYKEFISNALDYRKWFEFRFSFKRHDGVKKELTDKVFNTFSGGEKAMAMYIPFLTAISSQYEKAEKKDAPRLIALDEAFAGVDDKNIESMFKLVDDLDYDYIFNSQALWGTFSSIGNLAISELLRGENRNLVLVQNYLWNGNKRILRD